jgi:septum formation protein
MQPEFILASSSKARLSLLGSVEIVPSLVLSPNTDETQLKNETPRTYCLRVAEKKFDSALQILLKKNTPHSKHAIMLTADTTAACGRRILHKSYDKDEIRRHLKLISGRRHKVFTAIVCGLLVDGKVQASKKKVVESILKFKRLQPSEIESWVISGQCEGNAGGYTLNGIAQRYLQFIRGSYSNVIGLPLYEVVQSLHSFGYK